MLLTHRQSIVTMYWYSKDVRRTWTEDYDFQRPRRRNELRMIENIHYRNDYIDQFTIALQHGDNIT
jgi:hypothetical protein